MEKLFEKYLKEENSSINTNIFSSYKKEYLSNRKKAERQLEKDMTLWVMKNKIKKAPDEIKQQVKNDIRALFKDTVPSYTLDNISNLIEV